MTEKRVENYKNLKKHNIGVMILDMKKMVENGVIISNRSLSADVNEMVLQAPEITAIALPGQFVMLKNEAGSTFLRRPFGVADVNGDKLTIIYRLAGKGTNELSTLQEGARISIEGPLGNGFEINGPEHVCSDGVCRMVPPGKTLLIGGGVGIAPIIYTARCIAQQNPANKPVVLLGMKNKAERFWAEYFVGITSDIVITTDDGSLGVKGFAINAVPGIIDKAAAEGKPIEHVKMCGPMIMMEGIAKLVRSQGIECQVSMEKRMACGIGVCLGCTFEGQQTKKRRKVCADGPVFPAEEVFA